MKTMFPLASAMLITGFIHAQINPAIDWDSYGDSRCQENINNFIWSDAYFDEKNATFKSQGSAACTGVMINQYTPEGNMRQFYLTAEHCWDADNFPIDPTTGEFAFIFNYQSPNGNTGDVPLDNRGNFPIESRAFQGDDDYRFIHLSRVNEIEIQSWGDFALYEILEPIPPHFNVYYAGWSTNSSLFHDIWSPYVGIHHPAGDVKKVLRGHHIQKVDIWNESCHIVTAVIDFLFGWIWGHRTSTRIFCKWISIPWYNLILDVGVGTAEQGSSGSPLFTNTWAGIGKSYLGSVSRGLSLNPCEDVGNTIGNLYSRFPDFYWNRDIRDALNPDHLLSIDDGIGGRYRHCYPALENLNGTYWPHSEHNQNGRNDVLIRAANDITTSNTDPLTVMPGSAYTMEAGNSITFGTGFNVQAGATFNSFISNTPCNDQSMGKLDEEALYRNQVLNQLKKVQLPPLGTDKRASHFAERIKESLEMYPNPASDVLKLEWEAEAQIKVEIYAMDGSRIKEGYLCQGTSCELSVATLPKGSYILRLTINDEHVDSRVFSVNR